MPLTSKSFKLPIFWLLDLAFRSCGWLKQKCIFFLRETNCHIVACCTYNAGAAEHVLSHRFSLLPYHLSCYFQSSLATCCTAPTLHSMVKGPTRDPTVANPLADEDTGSDSGAESVTATTSSPTCGATLMAKGEVPKLSDFFKKASITDEERQAKHDRGWLTSNVLSSILEVDIPMVEGSTIVCFEPHLVAGLGLPSSKFLVTIMDYLNYELFHFNPNAISALSSFVMLCKCWLGIAPDTSLF
jgi:hypothetical protein